MQTQVESLHQKIARLEAIIAKKDLRIERLDLRIERLEEQIKAHLLARFGRKSEAYVNPDQLGLFNETETLSQSSEETEESTTKIEPHERKRGKRKPLPDFLPSERIEHDLADSDRMCAIHNIEMIKFGETISKQLDIEPAKIKVLEHVRPKHKCPCCEGNIKQAPMPAQPIAGSMATPSLLSFIAVSKYVDHLPLYRIEKQFERIFVDLPRLTMARWMIRLSEILTPLYNLLQEELLEGGILQMDETSIQVLDEPGRAAHTKSQMWVRGRDPTTGPPIILYDYDPSRGAAVIEQLLAGFSGVLQSDGYSGYDTFALGKDNVTHAGCLAHCRRKFWEAFKSSGDVKNSLAEAALKQFKAIYEVEAKTKGMTPDERLRHRQEYMRPLFDSLKKWVDEVSGKAPSSLKIGEAISYLSGQWPKLEPLLKDGRIPLDTNYFEGKIRPFTIGRKNWMFSATQEGAHASAMIYSIVETAKANKLEPFSYLKFAIEKLTTAKNADDIHAILPYVVAKDSLQ